MKPILQAHNYQDAQWRFAVRPPQPIARAGVTVGQRSHPSHIRTLFFLCGVFTVLPFFDIPFIGLSITAPLLLPVMYYALFQPGRRWRHRYRGWIMIALAVLGAIFFSFAANGPWFEGREFKGIELAYLIRYLFWVAVLLVTAYVASDFEIQRRLPLILGTSVVVLAGLRCFEGIVLGKIGAWSNTIFTTQNSYGILFSTFTPFLFPVFLGRGFLRKMLCTAGLFAVSFACAINGSRGSWICIALALAVFFLFSLASRPGASMRLILPVGFAALALSAALVGIPSVREAVFGRFSTLENLDRDKSYQARQVMNQRSLKLVALSPWFGTGPGRYREVYVPLEMPDVFKGRSDEDFMRKSPHNSYLSYLAEGGIVGALPLALLLGVLAVRGGWAALVLNRRGERWALGVYASFIAMSVHFWSLSGLTGTHAFFVYGLLAATVVLSTRIRQLKSSNPPRPQVAPIRTHLRKRSSLVVGSS